MKNPWKQLLYNQDKEFLSKRKKKKQRKEKKKEIEKMIDHNTILYIIYAVLILGGFAALFYHLFSGEEEE